MTGSSGQAARLPPAQPTAPLATAVVSKDDLQPLAITLTAPSQTPDYTGMAINGGIGLVAGILGALVGAWAAYLFGLKASREVKDREARERDAHLTFAVIHKLNRIYGTQKEIRRDTEEATVRLSLAKALAERAGANFLDHPSLEMRPLATAPARVHFTAEEVMAAMRIGGTNIQKTMMMIDDRHNTTIATMDLYRAQKANFENAVQAGATFDPASGHINFRWDAEQYATFRPQLYSLDLLVSALSEHSKEDELSTYNAIVALLKGRAKAGQAKSESSVAAPDGTLTKVSVSGEEVVDEIGAA